MRGKSAAGQEAPKRRRIDPHRRDRVIQGVIDTIAVHGVEGLTHRRVAEAAGVPLAATTYYFATLEDMLEDAMRVAAERDMAFAQERFGGASPEDLPEMLDAYVRHTLESDRNRIVVFGELYIAAVRRPGLREIVAEWEQAWTDLLAPGADRASGVVSALVGTAMLRAMIMHDAPEDAAQAVVAVFEALAGERASAG